MPGIWVRLGLRLSWLLWSWASNLTSLNLTSLSPWRDGNIRCLSSFKVIYARLLEQTRALTYGRQCYHSRESWEDDSAEELANIPRPSNFHGSASCMMSQGQGTNRKVGINHFCRHWAALRWKDRTWKEDQWSSFMFLQQPFFFFFRIIPISTQAPFL